MYPDSNDSSSLYFQYLVLSLHHAVAIADCNLSIFYPAQDDIS